MIALANLDEVIALIKGSETPAAAKSALCAKYELSEVQAQAILDLRLQKLTGLERLAIEKEHDELVKEIARLSGILADPAKVNAIIIADLKEAKDKFADPRRTQIEESADDDFDMEDLIEDEEMAVTISHKGYVKRTHLSNYRAQKRGGKGVSGAADKEDDFTEHFFVTSTHSYMLIFTTLGRMTG